MPKKRGLDYYECAIVLYNDDEKPGYLAATFQVLKKKFLRKPKSYGKILFLILLFPALQKKINIL